MSKLRPQNLRKKVPSSNKRHTDRPFQSGRDESYARARQTANRNQVSSELEEFFRYLHSPWNIIWRNIVAGLARGLGAVFGATVIVALAIGVLKVFVDLPLIGQYANQMKTKVDEMAEEARYSDDFVRLQSTMDRIDLRLKTQNELLEKLTANEAE